MASVMFRRIEAPPVTARLALVIAMLMAAAVVLMTPAEVGASSPVTSANARWLDATYPRLLGRPADDSGLDYHLAVISAGGSETRHRLAYDLLFSAEGSRAEVRRAYTELLGRGSDPVGEDYWTNHLSGHGVLDLRVLLMAADEYHLQAGGSDTAWLDALYAEVLERAPDPEGRAYWLALVTAGVPRASLAGAIYQSDEALGHRADAYYQDLLGRAPSAAERQEAIATVRARGERWLRAELWASDEAFEPFLDAAWS